MKPACLLLVGKENEGLADSATFGLKVVDESGVSRFSLEHDLERLHFF